MRFYALLLLLLTLYGCASVSEEAQALPYEENESLEVAVFAGGCFWCMEAAFEGEEGVVEVVSGYSGGNVENPSYEQVLAGTTGHYEAVQIYYDPSVVSYEELLDFFFRQIDPTDAGGQITDRGPQYRTAIFYRNESEKRIAQKVKEEVEDSGIFNKPIVTEILPFTKFHRAEEYHQDYYRKRIASYEAYVQGSGRKEKLKQVWEEG